MEYEITAEDKNATYVVLPAYNEATRIQPVLESIAEKGYNMVIDAVLNFSPKYVVSMDSDGQHSADDLDKVIKPLVTGEAQAVIGVRPLEDMPRSRNYANAIMNFLTKIFYRVDVSDSQTGFRAITRDALDKITINATGYLISSEFIREINDNDIPFAEVPIETIYTPETQAKGTNTTAAIKILLQMIKHQF